MKQFFIDMDGVLAVWDVEGTFEDTFKKGYFEERSAEPIVLDLIKHLQANDEDITILSAAYLTTDAKTEKSNWLKKHGVTVPVIFVPYGLSKADFIPDTGDEMVLIDDYSVNLHDWESFGERFRGVKFLNGINGSQGSWKGDSIANSMSVEEIYNILCN